MKGKDFVENKKKILRAVKMLKRISEEEAKTFGEASFGESIPWGDAVVQFRNGFFFASAFISVEKKMEEVLPLFAGETFPIEFLEAPSSERFEELKRQARKRITAAAKALKLAEKSGVKEKILEEKEKLEKSEKMLLKLEISEKLLLEPGCVKRFAVTTAKSNKKEEAIEKLKFQVRRILFRAGGRMLKEHEIKKCFNWEDAVMESVAAAEEIV